MEDDWARNLMQTEIQKSLFDVINKVMTKLDQVNICCLLLSTVVIVVFCC